MADLKKTIDLFDCDRILRVNSKVNKNEEIIRVLPTANGESNIDNLK
ncbi:hypothetical protein ADIARSV_0483 [Arcticibacter svalbardensis MN12-7]|uniref:Uncharacterized protein n=1 Tax=Arcticibacter svalbardensis MN12-7 TaxID=1150600 RepID=R9GWZ2_9SPHI|nr:hypothetical protein [Arcticibacter svalbardensis]EOR96337.1 hypothetical protein ADIARSV_0483 [Arcticibacter svalbardensis MN12-7]